MFSDHLSGIDSIQNNTEINLFFNYIYPARGPLCKLEFGYGGITRTSLGEIQSKFSADGSSRT
jgi:hypothetical protein